MKFLTDEFERALLTLDRESVDRIISEFLNSGNQIQSLSEIVTNALERIGAAWEEGKISLSQVYMSGIICEEVIDKLSPPSNAKQKNAPVIAIGVFEDYHVLGKRVIYSSLRAAGYELIDLGSGLNTEDVVKAVKERGIKILLLSVLMLRSALKVKQLKEKLSDTGVKIIVGGAPFRFDENLWEEVGAYATGKDPSEAIKILSKLMGEKV